MKDPGFQWTAWVDGVIPTRNTEALWWGSTGERDKRIARGHVEVEHTCSVQGAAGEHLRGTGLSWEEGFERLAS